MISRGKKIVAIGRNYAEHAKELGNAVPTEPMMFLKPTSSYLTQESGRPIVIPAQCTSLHHEIELGVVIGKDACKVSQVEAGEYIGGYVLALDMTARDLQEAAKKNGHPWSVCKGYDTFCPIGEFISKSKIQDHSNVELWCKVNDKLVQSGNTRDMIFSVETLISYVSQIMTLNEGDVILTGTPSGVGPVIKGDVISAGIKDVCEMKFNVE